MKGKVRYMYPGANTPLGFYSYYEQLLPQRNAKKIFCIKGGPGTGKSTFIKGIGEYFVDKNENVDLFRCSADPESFDGILLKNRSVLILDGTSPHVVDPHNPAAVDKIIDFGIFWNENKIKKHRDEIINCNEKISRLYGVAYGYLKCLLHEYELIWQIIQEHINEQQIDIIVEDIISSRDIDKRNTKGTLKKMFASAISSKGVLNELRNLSESCDEVYIVKSPVGFKTQLVMEPILAYYINRGYDVEAYYCPVFPGEKIEHLIIPELSLMIATSNDQHELMAENCYEIVLDNKSSEYVSIMLNELYRQSQKTLADSIGILKKAKLNHDILESYYIESVDFASINDFKREIIVEIQHDCI